MHNKKALIFTCSTYKLSLFFFHLYLCHVFFIHILQLFILFALSLSLSHTFNFYLCAHCIYSKGAHINTSLGCVWMLDSWMRCGVVCWIEYLCVSCVLSHYRLRMHRVVRGSECVRHISPLGNSL